MASARVLAAFVLLAAPLSASALDFSWDFLWVTQFSIAQCDTSFEWCNPLSNDGGSVCCEAARDGLAGPEPPRLSTADPAGTDICPTDVDGFVMDPRTEAEKAVAPWDPRAIAKGTCPCNFCEPRPVLCFCEDAPISGGGDPYINVGKNSLFLDAPPNTDVNIYSRFGGINVTVTMDGAGLYFAGARLEWDGHILTVASNLVNAAAEVNALLDGTAMSSGEPVVVGGVELTVSQNMVEVKVLETAAREHFRILAAENSAKIEDDDDSAELSAHIDFDIKNKANQIFGTHLSPAGGTLAKMFSAEMRRRHRSLLLEDQFQCTCLVLKFGESDLVDGQPCVLAELAALGIGESSSGNDDEIEALKHIVDDFDPQPPAGCRITQGADVALSCPNPNTFTSINHPEDYNNNLFGVIEVQGPACVSFTSFNTEKFYDFVNVIDGAGNRVGEYDGAIRPPDFYVPASETGRVVFTTDDSEVRSGFSLRCTPGACEIPPPQPPGCRITQGADVALSSPEENTFTSINFEENYNNNLGGAIEVQGPACVSFTAFNTEEFYDFVYVIDGAGNLVGEYDGTTIPPDFDVPASETGSVEFTTDDSVVRSGFSLRCTPGACPSGSSSVLGSSQYRDYLDLSTQERALGT